MPTQLEELGITNIRRHIAVTVDTSKRRDQWTLHVLSLEDPETRAESFGDLSLNPLLKKLKEVLDSWSGAEIVGVGDGQLPEYPQHYEEARQRGTDSRF